MSDTVLVEQEITIEASAETVFALLTDAKGLREWMAVESGSEVVVGGRVCWRHEDVSVMSGRFVEIEPPTRLVFSYGWEEGGLDVPPESTQVTIDLEERDGVTQLRLVHRRLPLAVVEDHRRGWEYFLGKLASCAAARP